MLRITRCALGLGKPRLLPRMFASTALAGDAASPFPLTQLFAMMQAKESEIRELRLAKDADAREKDAARELISRPSE